MCPESDSWLSCKAGAGLSQGVVVVMLSRTCVPVLSLATICSTDLHDEAGRQEVIEDECVSGSDPVGADDELVDAAGAGSGSPVIRAVRRFAAAVGNGGPRSQVEHGDRVDGAAVVQVDSFVYQRRIIARDGHRPNTGIPRSSPRGLALKQSLATIRCQAAKNAKSGESPWRAD